MKHARTIGTALSMLVLAGLAIWAAVTAYQGHPAADAETIEAAPATG